MKSIKIFSPATIANLNCGFDILGLAINDIGDEMELKIIKDKNIKIKFVGNSYGIPTEVEKNVAGKSLLELMKNTNIDHGFELILKKNIKPSSGIGSSAASAAGAVWAANKLLNSPFSKHQLTKFAMEGEKIASNNESHADNIAPAIFGGITLIRSYDPLDIINIPVIDDMYFVILTPHLDIKTNKARKILKQLLPLKDIKKQTGNISALILGLIKKDYSIISRSLEDHIVEPQRKILMPKYDDMKKIAIKNSAIGFGISGSGPSVFSIAKGEKSAISIKDKLKDFYSKLDIPFQIYTSSINTKGIYQIN